MFLWIDKYITQMYNRKTIVYKKMKGAVTSLIIGLHPLVALRSGLY